MLVDVDRHRPFDDPSLGASGHQDQQETHLLCRRGKRIAAQERVRWQYPGLVHGCSKLCELKRSCDCFRRNIFR